MDHSSEEVERIPVNTGGTAWPFEFGSCSRLPVDISKYDYSIAIPALNEEGRILACLEACMRSMQRAERSGLIVLGVNNTTDGTEQVARSWAQQTSASIDISSTAFPPHLAHAGAARRLVLDRARCFVNDRGALLTTDADSLPDPAWVSANLEMLERNDVLVCGHVDLDRDEVKALPDGVFETGHSEYLYKLAASELEALLDPDRSNPWPHHGQASGASLAMTARCYDAVGGLPIVPCGEDRALAQAFRRHGFGVVFSDEPKVITSCRLDGRAAGGLADTISYRMEHDDFPCDEALETPAKLWRRATLRAKLRLAMASGNDISTILETLQLTPDDFASAVKISRFGELWYALERSSPLLTRERMTRREMESYMRELVAMLNGLKSKKAPRRKAWHSNTMPVGESCAEV